MRGDVSADARLIEGIDVCIAPVEHAIQLENIAVGISAAELVAGSLEMVSAVARLSKNGVHRNTTRKHSFVLWWESQEEGPPCC